MAEKNYITPKGFQKLSDELNQLGKLERPELLKVIAWAASLGDRSENADYQYGKRRLREIDKRLNFLSSRLDAAVVVDPDKIVSKVVQFGATVTIKNIENEECRVVVIVGVDEVDSKLGHFSWKSPLGTALMGKSIGDLVVVQAPVGMIEYEITKVAYLSL